MPWLSKLTHLRRTRLPRWEWHKKYLKKLWLPLPTALTLKKATWWHHLGVDKHDGRSLCKCRRRPAGKREPQLRTWLQQTGLGWIFLIDVVCPHHCGQCHPCQEALGCARIPQVEQIVVSKLVSSIPASQHPLLQLLSWPSSVVTPSVTWEVQGDRSPFFPQL